MPCTWPTGSPDTDIDLGALVSLTDPAAPAPPVPVRFDIARTGRDTTHRRATVRAQLEHLFPAAAFPIHLGYGPPPAGFRTVDAWRVIPDRRSPRSLVPLQRAAARASVVSHNRLREPRVAATRLLAAAAMGPLALAQGSSTVLRLSVPVDVDDTTVQATVITRHLRSRVPGTVATAVSLRDFHPRAKPTVQLLGADGAVLAFAKVASDPTTGRRVRVEADLLAEAGPTLARSGSTIRLPRLIEQGCCGPFAYSIVEPLPQAVRRVGRVDRDRVLRPLMNYAAALGEPRPLALSATSLWREVMERVEVAQQARAERPDLVIGLNQLVATARGMDGGTVLTAGLYHGDWVPWNMGWAPRRACDAESGSSATGPGSSQDLLWVWDLEYGSRTGPIGLDALRWVFQVQHVLHRRSLTDAVAATTAAAGQLLPRLGVPAQAGAALVRLHVIETMATALGLLAQGRGLPDGLDPDAVDVMQALRLVAT